MSGFAFFRDPECGSSVVVAKRVCSVVSSWGTRTDGLTLTAGTTPPAQETWEVNFTLHTSIAWDGWKFILGKSNNIWLYQKGAGLYMIGHRYWTEEQVQKLRDVVVWLLDYEIANEIANDPNEITDKKGARDV